MKSDAGRRAISALRDLREQYVDEPNAPVVAYDLVPILMWIEGLVISLDQEIQRQDGVDKFIRELAGITRGIR